MRLVSIIVPVYNAEESIEKCLDSILNQTYTNFECIIVNDGSTDGSHEIIQQYLDKDKRFRYVQQINSGPGITRNVGLEKSVGDYVTFVDSDDYIHPYFLQHMLECAKSYDADIVQCSEFKDGKDTHIDYLSSKIICFDGCSDNVLAFVKYGDIKSYCWGKLYRKEVIKDIYFPNIFFSEDKVFILRTLLHTSRTCVLNQKLYCYCNNVNSLTRSHFSLKQLDDIKGAKMMYDTCLSSLPEAALYIASYIASHSAIYYINLRRTGLDRNSQELMLHTFRRFYSIISNVSLRISIKRKCLLFFFNYCARFCK